MSQHLPPVATEPGLVVSTAEWADYFARNKCNLMPIPWEAGATMTAVEKQAIAASIAEFQLGESGEGKHVMHFARQYAQRSGDLEYFPTMGVFLAEEHRHARDLGRLMDLEGLARQGRTIGDSIFRTIRSLSKLELAITVLVTAEVIAQVYYQGLRDATRSPILRAICGQILRDEDEHVRFQCERLAMLRSKRSGFTQFNRAGIHRALMTGAVLIVWRNHRRALRAGGFGFRRYWRECWSKFDVAMAIASPRNYRWPAAVMPAMDA